MHPPKPVNLAGTAAWAEELSAAIDALLQIDCVGQMAQMGRQVAQLASRIESVEIDVNLLKRAAR